MSAMVSLSARTAERPTTCIIDARLALAPGGIVLASQLGRIGKACLTRRFWTMVDGAYFYHSYPDELLSGSAADGAGIVEALMLWHTAWLNGALDGVFFWIGDARRESALPTDWDCDVIRRYERLSEAFPADAGAEATTEPLTACGHEAFALAAALNADAPIILTRLHDDDRQPPSICREAAAIARLDVHGPGEWDPDPVWIKRLIPAPIRPLVDQLACLGTRIAVVHTLAPGAISLAVTLSSDESAPADEPGEPDRADRNLDRRPWRNAHVFWHELAWERSG
jgi:hypothetical protein